MKKKLNKLVSIPFVMYERLDQLAKDNQKSSASEYLKNFLQDCKIDTNDIKVIISIPRDIITEKDKVRSFLNSKVDLIVKKLDGK